jgi:hypothetical protein
MGYVQIFAAYFPHHSDGLGRMIYVWEDPSSLNYETDYSYNLLDGLVSVNQKGNNTTARVRSFSYDSLSRLLCAANPESGTGTCPTAPTGYIAGTTGYT